MKPANEIVRLTLDGSSAPQVLVTGNDFYAFPRMSPDGRRLAWTTWNHPNMPWDGCELWVADLEARRSLTTDTRSPVAIRSRSSSRNGVPPATLDFISDRSNWWNLYRLDGDQIVPVAPMDAEIRRAAVGLRLLPLRLPAGRCASPALIARDGNDHLGVIRPGSDDVATIETGMTTLDYLHVSDDGRIWIIAGSPTEFPTIVAVDPKSRNRRARLPQLRPEH